MNKRRDKSEIRLEHSAQANDRIHTGLKVPPHSIEAEQAVLGGLMLSDSAFDKICNIVKEDDFYRNDHRIIFRTIAALAAKDQPRDVVTMSEAMDPTELERAGGMLYLGTLAKDTPSAANVIAYAAIVAERSALRKLIAAGEEIASEAYSPPYGTEISEIIDSAQSKIFSLAESVNRGVSGGVVSVRSLVSPAIDRIDTRYHKRQAGEEVQGLSCGFTDIDKLLLGLQRADLIIVAARPSMGKSTFAQNVCQHVSVNLKKPSLYFSMEMSKEQFMDRMISSIGNIELEHIRDGDLTAGEWSAITAASVKINESPLFIDDAPALNVMQVRARSRQLRRDEGLELIVVDYLQMMTAVRPNDSRHQEITEISRGLKSIAKELNIPVIALCQLNRGLESRPDKRPRMSDLRESGAIEEDADVIGLMYRDVVYNEKCEKPRLTEINFPKHRQGATAKKMLWSELEFARFINCHRSEYEDFADEPAPHPAELRAGEGMN